jgi:hypothetical protein
MNRAQALHVIQARAEAAELFGRRLVWVGQIDQMTIRGRRERHLANSAQNI